MTLCDSINPIEPYNGRNVDKMPQLLADGRVPMSTFQLMNYRINDSDRFPDWKNLYFDTSDLIAYSSKGDGKVKFIFTVGKDGKITNNGKNALKLINPDSKISSGAIELGDQYQSLEGIEVAIGNLGRTENHLIQSEILGNKVWRILARHPDEVPKEFAEDPNLLKEYSTWVTNQTKSDKNMGVYIDYLDKSPKLRAWFVYGLGGWSLADGGDDLDGVSGRLVGLAPEAQNTIIVRPTLEQAVAIVNQNLIGLEIKRK